MPFVSLLGLKVFGLKWMVYIAWSSSVFVLTFLCRPRDALLNISDRKSVV